MSDYQPISGNQIQQASSQPTTLAKQIESMRDQFQLAMPKGMEATQLVRDAQTVLRQTPKLAECDPATVFGALMTCSQLGLRPGVLGQAYLLPLWNGRNRRFEAQLILGYQGMLELIYRSGSVSMIAARVVHERDEFMIEYGLAEDQLIHRPPTSGSRGEPVAFYAIARMKDGGYAMTDVMSVADMEKHRDKYAMAKKKDGTIVGPWKTEFAEMAKKSMIRQLAKMLPKSPEVARAITHDGAVRVNYDPQGIDDSPAFIESTVVDKPADPQLADPQPADPVEAEVVDEAPLAPTDAQIRRLHALCGENGLKDRAERLAYLTEQVQRPISSSKDLTRDEVSGLIDVLGGDR